jgi:parvulin-like peptidyl-prolyl isomerase
VLKQELAEVAFNLKVGETSGVIDQPEACYLMLVEDRRPAHVRPLGELRDEIERTLMLEQRARLQKRYVDKLKAKTFVRYF